MKKQLERIKELKESIDANDNDIWNTVRGFNQMLRANELLENVEGNKYEVEEMDFKIEDGQIQRWYVDEFMVLHKIPNNSMKEVLDKGCISILFERIIQDLEKIDNENKEVVKKLAAIKELLN